MACLVPGPPASSDGNTPRQARMLRTPVAETRWGSTDWRKPPLTVPRPSHLSLVTSAHSGFLSCYMYEIFEDVDSSKRVWPECQAAKCPLRWVRDEGCSGGGCRW